MRQLPDEIWTDILDYLEPADVLAAQRVSHQLLKLARDPALWRNKVFEKAPSASTRPNALTALTGALGGLSLGGPATAPAIVDEIDSRIIIKNRLNNRARAVLDWDLSHQSEKIDWYSEYIARHAPLSSSWVDNNLDHEIRGMALFRGCNRMIGSFDDGSLGIWDISRSESQRRRITQLGRSRRKLLFEDVYSLGESSLTKRTILLGANVENISVDSKRNRAFVAVENILNEIDLERMDIVSQNKFAWTITALSQETDTDHDLTVGTLFSLHIHDSRLPIFQPNDNANQVNSTEDSKIAFLQNYGKGLDIGSPDVVAVSRDMIKDYQTFSNYPKRSNRSNRLEAYARVEPGPQSIIHHGENEIVIAGRMPSILFYDRRNFPQPRTAIHSGARLSAMTISPIPPAESSKSVSGDQTLIACGEYGGRGSLEIYELPWDKHGSHSNPTRITETDNTPQASLSRPFSFRNRQEASSSKLLSVVTQGTRIVFSDSDGTLKWVERDGRGLARRWNINSYQMDDRGATVTGDKVVRKMIALPEDPSGRGKRGDGDLLVWTGEKIGIVTTKPKPWDDHEDLVRAFERGMDLNDSDTQESEREIEYSTMMRRALERQADERRWMSRFGGRRW